MSTIKAVNLQHPSSASVNLTTDANGNVSSAGTLAMSTSFLRNRIINGQMYIWQRGTSGSIATTGTYFVDRWIGYSNTVTGTYSIGTSTVNGFPNAAFLTGAVGNTALQFQQRIESVNCYDLNSATVTVSFWVYQNTGAALSTANVVLGRANATDNFTTQTQIGSTYTIPSIPNATWTRVVCSFTTDATASNGVSLTISTGAGFSAAQSFAITGVQLEAGTIATPFEQRQYAQELALCQRYYEVQVISIYGYISTGSGLQTTQSFAVSKRTASTVAAAGGTFSNQATGDGVDTAYTGLSGYRYILACTTAGGGGVLTRTITANAEL